MGKAAENERIKLRATFYNNVAVGAAVTGLIIPYVAATRVLGAKELSIRNWADLETLVGQNLFSFVTLETLVGMSIAFTIVVFCRLRATSHASQLDD